MSEPGLFFIHRRAGDADCIQQFRSAENAEYAIDREIADLHNAGWQVINVPGTCNAFVAQRGSERRVLELHIVSAN